MNELYEACPLEVFEQATDLWHRTQTPYVVWHLNGEWFVVPYDQDQDGQHVAMFCSPEWLVEA